MKPSFLHKPVNGPFDDPAVYMRVLRESRALLFDAGDIAALSNREILKITDIFVTHAHIDHFIGFDTIIRILLKRNAPVVFYGPEGIIDQIQGRLRGYSWNLISEYALVIHVVEIKENQVSRATFRAPDGFERINTQTEENTGIVLENSLFAVSAVVLEHGIPTLGYSIKEKLHININKAALADFGFEVGPWLGRLKDFIRNGQMDREVDTGKGIHKISDLKHIYMMTEGQKVSYIMDSSPTDDNINRIVDFVADADSLYIEAYFIHKDLELAMNRNHLTAGIAGRIAKKAGVKNLHLLHFSPRYMDNPDVVVNEAWEAYRPSTSQDF